MPRGIIGVCIPLTQGLRDGDSIACFGVIAALLEGASRGIDISDAVNGLDIDVVNRVACNDDGVNLGGIETN